MMVGYRAEVTQIAGHFGRSHFHRGIGRATQDADAAFDRYRAGSPTVLSVLVQPAVRDFVIDVGRVEEGHQNIHVEKGDPHSSSRNRFTNSRSGLGLPGIGVKSRIPLRYLGGALAASDWRASSEMTCPSVTPCCRASCFAVLTRSSSSSRVVRIPSA